MGSTVRRRLAQAGLTAALALISAVPLADRACAQVATQPMVRQQAQRGGLNPDSFYGKETFQGVSVRDSLEAVKKIEDARRMERLEDWNKAADWYQEVIEKYGQYVVPSDTDAQNNIRQYTGIERPVQEQLAKWPKSGLDAYRNRYGAVAATLLDQAKQGDKETLSRVMKLYFVTDAGKQAGIKLLDLLLEDGDFAEASRVGERLLDWHPNLVVERPRVLFRTALAMHLSGDEKRSKERYEQLKNKHAGAVGTLFGKDIVLSDALERLQQVAPPISIATASGAFRLNPGGDESRSMISAAPGRPGALLATIDISPPPAMRNMPNGMQGQDIETISRRDRDSGSNQGILPVADDGELYFQDGSRVYAVSLQSGVALPGWIQSYPSTNGQYTINSYGFSRTQQSTLTLTENAVLGIMGYSDRLANYGNGMPVYGSDRGTRLVCLDRATGKERWVARPAKIVEENLRGLDFSGSPLVVADNVYVIGRGGKNITAEDCYVLCFDLNSGAYKWSCFIASSNNNFAYNGQMPSADTLSHLAYSSGRVYVLTNLGAAAALDAYSGTISWLNIYPRDNAMLNQDGVGFRGMGNFRQGGNSGSTRAWEFNPVIVRDGKVFLLPTDAKHLMVYDAGSGAEIKRIAISDFQKRPDDGVGPQALVAVDGDQVILTGGQCIYCIDWTKPADPQKSILWFSQFATNIKGRAFVTADSVFVCIESGVVAGKPVFGGLHRIERVSRKTGMITGKVVEIYPPKKDWDEGEGPGNVLVVGEQVIVAGPKRINVYADMALARKRLDDDVAAAPADPEPRLRYAEVMFVAGQLPVAMEKLEETIKLLGGITALRPGGERDHLFNDCITFAAKLQREKKSDKIEETIDAITRLYDLAGSAADGDSQQVNYRISRAKFNRDFVQDDSLSAAVKLYQEILSNQRLRTVPLADEEAGASQAALVAEKMITEVKKIRPEAYASFETLAGQALEAAGNDPALLKSVAETYPNSASAPQAMIAAADAFEGQSNYRLAAYTRRQAYNKYGETANKPKLLEGMARNYLAMPDRTADRIDTAAARLSAIVKLGADAAATPLAKPLKLPGDVVLAEAGVTVNDALKALQNYKAQAVAAKLPDFRIAPTAGFQLALAEWRAAGSDPATKPRLPAPFVPAAQQLVLPNVDALIKTPLELRQQNARHDRVVAWSNGSVLLYPVGQPDAIGASADLAAAPKNLAWLDDNKSLLLWNDKELVLLSGDDAKLKWKKIELKSLPRIDVVASGSSDETISGGGTNNNDNENAQFQQLQLRGGRRIINGRMMGQMPAVANNQPQAAPATPGVEAIASVRPVDDKIIVATTAGQLFAIRTDTGALVWHTRLSAAAPISHLAATDDFVVAKVDDAANTQLVVLETLTGQIVRPRLSFPNEQGNVPVNFALAPDGTLVWIQQDRLCGKDLFEPRKELNYEVIAGQNDNVRNPNNVNIAINRGQQVDATSIYGGAVNPDQLLISEGRILVVAQSGRFVCIHSLETGKLLDFPQADGKRAEARLATAQGDGSKSVADWGVALHLVGSRLYVCSRQNGPVCYNLDKAGVLWDGHVDINTVPTIEYREPFIGQDYFAILDHPAARVGANPNPNTARLHCFSRAKVDKNADRESGRLDHISSISDPAGISEFQGVDGGFYYLTGDRKLHYLKGGRP
jgi:outer membrane protein assembly factor BamB